MIYILDTDVIIDFLRKKEPGYSLVSKILNEKLFNQEIGSLFVDLKVKLEEKGEKLADFDLLIASTSKLYKLILVTRNVKHFERTGVKILN